MAGRRVRLMLGEGVMEVDKEPSILKSVNLFKKNKREFEGKRSSYLIWDDHPPLYQTHSLSAT